MEEALKGYRAANGGKDPQSSQDPTVLVPFFNDPAKAASFVELVRRRINPAGYSEPNAAGHALNLYHAANHGEYPATPQALAPYFQNPADAARYLSSQTAQTAP
jgi:hypothetical protein